MPSCFPPDLNDPTRIPPLLSTPNDYSQPMLMRRGRKQKMKLTHRDDVLPPVTERPKEKKNKQEKCVIDFCLCTADIKDPQKEGKDIRTAAVLVG